MSSDKLERAETLSRAFLKMAEGVSAIFSEVPSGAQDANSANAFGIVVGILAAAPVPVTQVMPLETKEATGLGKNATKSEIIGWATERFVVPMLNKAFNGLNETKTIEVFGKKIDIALSPNKIEFDVVGAIIMLDSELRAQGDQASPGFVFVANTLPAMDKSQGFQLAIEVSRGVGHAHRPRSAKVVRR